MCLLCVTRPPLGHNRECEIDDDSMNDDLTSKFTDDNQTTLLGMRKHKKHSHRHNKQQLRFILYQEIFKVSEAMDNELSRSFKKMNEVGKGIK